MSAAGLLAPLGGLAGAAVGSWLGTAAVRGRQGASAWSGRSRCDHCAAPLGYGDTLPVVSFLRNLGHCRHCAGPISLVHPLSEVAGAMAGAAIVLGVLHG